MTERNGPKCGGKLHNRDTTCTLPAGWGTDPIGYGRCRKHLGNTPNVAKAAERERLGAEANRILAQLDVKPVDDPLARKGALDSSGQGASSRRLTQCCASLRNDVP